MPHLRSSVRRFAAIWLCCQVLSVCVLGAADVRDVYRASATNAECDGHAGLCPIEAVTGVPCPMHSANTESGRACSMRGLCSTPVGTLSVLLTVPGVLVDTVFSDMGGFAPAVSPVSPSRLDVFLDNDAPPPRA
jgi:hypothetical protein